MYSEEILEILGEERRAGAISVLSDAGPSFELIEQRFPVGMGRIAWEKVANKEVVEVFPLDAGELHASEVATKLEGCREKVTGWFAEARIEPSERVIWIGDETDVGVEMKAECALKLFVALFSFPQHAYILGADKDWCLNYVMEGELIFSSGERA